jgi:hypothetical protein
MTGSENEPEPQVSSFLEDEDLANVWKRFQRGAVIACAIEGSQVALNVDGSTRAYRFVCTHCGRSSSWFEDSLGGTFRIRSTTVPQAMDDDDNTMR